MYTHSPSIVIIDDEEDLCFLLAARLQAMGYRVSYKHVLEEGLDLVDKLKPDWVILDNKLPDGYGWRRIAEIKSMSASTRIIKISADPEESKQNDSINAFALTKPIDVNVIAEILKKNP